MVVLAIRHFLPYSDGIGPWWVAVIFVAIFAVLVWVIIQDCKNNSSA